MFFLKQHHFWSNYNNYSNFFPKTTIVILLVYKNFDCIDHETIYHHVVRVPVCDGSERTKSSS